MTEKGAVKQRPEDTGRDWEWRRKVRSNPHSHRVYRTVVGVVGAAVVVVGLVMVPFPGPGWLVVFIGIGILASEFERAQRLLDFGKHKLRAWNAWMRPKPLWVKALVGLATAVLVAAFFYGLFLLAGVPGFVPDVFEVRLEGLPGL